MMENFEDKLLINRNEFKLFINKIRKDFEKKKFFKTNK